MRQKLELVGRSSGLVENLKGANLFVVQLLLWLRKVKVGSIQPYSISNLVVVCAALLFIILSFHPSGGFFQHGLGFFMDGSHVLGEFFGCRVRKWGQSWGVREDSGVVSVEDHEGALAVMLWI